MIRLFVLEDDPRLVAHLELSIRQDVDFEWVGHSASVTEALRAGGFANRAKVEIKWVTSDDCATPEGARAALADVDAICVPGGFGVRGIEGKVGALNYARLNKIPTLGLCLGLQCMVIEAARNLAGLKDANSAEFEPDTKHPVISTMVSQEEIVAGRGNMGGTMRLGLYPAQLESGSIVAGLYGSNLINERHRHRYEVNNLYVPKLEQSGLIISARTPNESLPEMMELPDSMHPWFFGVQFHPEFTSTPRDGHPLFSAFIKAALVHQDAAMKQVA